MYNIFPPSWFEFELGLLGFNKFLSYYYLLHQLNLDLLHSYIVPLIDLSWLRIDLEYGWAIIVWSQLTLSFATWFLLRLLKSCALEQILEVECELSS